MTMGPAACMNSIEKLACSQWVPCRGETSNVPTRDLLCSLVGLVGDFQGKPTSVGDQHPHGRGARIEIGRAEEGGGIDAVIASRSRFRDWGVSRKGRIDSSAILAPYNHR